MVSRYLQYSVSGKLPEPQAVALPRVQSWRPVGVPTLSPRRTAQHRQHLSPRLCPVTLVALTGCGPQQLLRLAGPRGKTSQPVAPPRITEFAHAEPERVAPRASPSRRETRHRQAQARPRALFGRRGDRRSRPVVCLCRPCPSPIRPHCRPDRKPIRLRPGP